MDGEFRGVGPRNWRRADEQILADVCQRMAEHPRLDASEIDVVVANGEGSLQGVVVSRATRRLAEDIADTVSGVRNVDNHLRVREGCGEVRRAA
jgi:hyperosmotically inducible periplasmic protein